MPVSVKTIACWTLTFSLAVIAFPVSFVAVGDILEYILPCICPVAPRRDIHETPDLNPSVRLTQVGVTFIVSVWAAMSTGLYFLEPRLRKTIAFWTSKLFFAVIAFLVSVVALDIILSYLLPTPNALVIVMKYGVTLVVGAWAGISTWQYFLHPRLREGRQGAEFESIP